MDEPVFSGRYQMKGYIIEKYFIKGEGNYIIPYLLMMPDDPAGKALIYLHPDGKNAEAAAGGEMEWFVKHGFAVLAPDMVGTGEMGPGIFVAMHILKADHITCGTSRCLSAEALLE